MPDDRAQYAKNCEFTGGSLQPMAEGFLLQTMVNNPVRGIYTEDGINFYTWPTETLAFKGPTIGDVYNRVYHLTPGVGKFNVSTTAGMAYNGPSPSAGNTWKAGVPRPTVAPSLSLVRRTTLSDYPNATVKIEAWWEYGGKQYDKATVSFVTITPFLKFSFTPPNKTANTTTTSTVATTPYDPFTGAANQAYIGDSGFPYDPITGAINPLYSGPTTSTQTTTANDGTPDKSTLAAKLSFLDTDSREIVAVVVRPGSISRSSALPGGLEVSLDESGAVTVTWGIVETRAYVFTCRNAWLEQGAPSPASLISPTYMDDVQLTLSAPSFTGYRPLQDYRVYRTYGSNPAYVGVTVTGSGSVFTDASNAKSVVGEALESTDWTPPPDGMQGCVLMPNGWFAGFVGNTLYMSEPYRPHAWPYSMTFAKSIRGLAVAQQSIVVTTADGVHVVTGAFPASAQNIRLASPQPGISQRSMAPVDGAVAYASNDGIVFVEGASATIDISQKLFTRAKWREFCAGTLDDASITFAYHDGCLVASSQTSPDGFTLRLDEGVGALSRIDAGFNAMFYLPVTDSLYYSKGAAVYLFKGGGVNKTLDWRGKDWVYPNHVTFGAAYIRADGPVTVKIYAEDTVVYTATQVSGYFRLPSLTRALRWSVRFVGNYDIKEFGMAQSMMELKSV